MRKTSASCQAGRPPADEIVKHVPAAVNPDAHYHTTVQLISDWRGRMLFARPRSMHERLLDYLLPVLWGLAVVVASAGIIW
jgi:hypothetical protein